MRKNILVLGLILLILILFYNCEEEVIVEPTADQSINFYIDNYTVEPFLISSYSFKILSNKKKYPRNLYYSNTNLRHLNDQDIDNTIWIQYYFDFHNKANPTEKEKEEYWETLNLLDEFQSDQDNFNFYKELIFYDENSNFIFKITNTLTAIFNLTNREIRNNTPGGTWPRRYRKTLSISNSILTNAFYGTTNE